MISLALAFLALAGAGVRALPAASLDRRGSVLSPPALSAIIPFVQFSRVAYCPTSKIQGWKCGQACDALPGFEPTLHGGDGNAVQNFFVGYWPEQKSIVVGHEGTDPLKLQSVLTDINMAKSPLNATLFPGAPKTVEVHRGFANEHARTAPAIFNEVQKLLSSTGANRVTTVGHSLGGALAILDGLSLHLRLPASVEVAVRTFGAPRVGNPGFVSLFDSKIADIQRVNNKQDLVPTIPLANWGFKHPAGEIHILGQNNAVVCAGDDNNSDPQCSALKVPTLLQGNIFDHLGPYQGVSIGTTFCN